MHGSNLVGLVAVVLVNIGILNIIEVHFSKSAASIYKNSINTSPILKTT